MDQSFKQMENAMATVLRSLETQLQRLFLWVPVGLAVGIGLYFSQSTEPQNLYNMGVLAAIFFGFYYGLMRKTDGVYSRSYAFIFAVLGCVALGFFMAHWKTQRMDTPMLLKETGYVSIKGMVDDVEPMQSGYRYVLSDLYFDDKKAPINKARITVRGADKTVPHAGDVVRVSGVLSPPAEPSYPGGYDFARVAYFQGIGGVGYAVSDIDILEVAKREISFENTRQAITKIIKTHIQNPDNAAILTAFMTGDKKMIDRDVLDHIRDSGLAHLLAISGLHVGFVAGLLFFMVRGVMAAFPYCALHWPLKKIAAVVAFIGTFLFMMVVGASVPTQRAMVMTGLALIAIMGDRTAISLRLVAIAATVILLLNPQELLSLSFQLSFAAVTLLVGFYGWFRPFWVRLYGQGSFFRRAVLYVTGLSLTSLIAGFATAPLVLYAFNRLALYSIAGNILALPIMGAVIMPFILLSYILMPFGLAHYPLWVAEQGVAWVLFVSEKVSQLEGGVLLTPDFSITALIIMVMGILMIILWLGRAGKAVGLAMLIVGAGVAFMSVRPDILITEKMDLIAVKNNKGDYMFSQLRRERFTRDMWASSNGQENTSIKWPYDYEGDDKGNDVMRCDNYSCVYHRKGHVIAFPISQNAMIEDCSRADYVFWPEFIKDDAAAEFMGIDAKWGCSAEQLISRGDTWLNGTTAVYITKQGLDMQTVAAHRGTRPWVQTRKKYTRKD